MTHLYLIGCKFSNPPIMEMPLKMPYSLFGSKRVLSTWSSLSQSPIIRDYAWSPLVTAGVTRNFALLKDHVPPTSDSSSIGSRSSTINGLVAVHLRRGDYVRHCPRLASWGATYMGFNQFPSLPDRFEPPEFSELTSLDGRNQYYLQHCWPEISDIVKKLHEVRKENTELKRVYILTNGWGWWVNNLKDALLADGWGDVRGSLDVQLDKEQLYVSMAVDMAIAERAEIFIGNGVRISFFLLWDKRRGSVNIILVNFITVLQLVIEHCYAAHGKTNESTEQPFLVKKSISSFLNKYKLSIIAH